MKKIDYKKELKHLYGASAKKAEIVDVPMMNFLMIDGAGDPNTSPEFQEAVEALFSVSYTLKFMIKKGELEVDYGVLPLEGLWWADDMSQFSTQNKENWKWTLMIMQPAYVTTDLVRGAIEQVKKKKKAAAAPGLRFEAFSEGNSAQVMHIGPFSEEGPTIETLHQFIEENSFNPSGKHHEIYLSDFRRAAPEKLKTIIRQPIV
ncbi:GyrI-like domain-containing protein [bacterium]|nr:GyrI-like domain-containing protein [bacterium]